MPRPACHPGHPSCRCGPSPATCQACVPFESRVQFDVDNDRPVYMDAAGRCRPCAAHPRSSGCEACDRQGRCTKCSTGFVLVNGACKKVRRAPSSGGVCTARQLGCEQTRRQRRTCKCACRAGTLFRCRAAHVPARPCSLLHAHHMRAPAAPSRPPQCKGGAECVACRPDTLECTTCSEGHGFAGPANKTCVPCATELCGVCQDFRCALTQKFGTVAAAVRVLSHDWL